jgi:O6-methylguanine-DNA--protein-cysteine methyltransferase
LNGPRRKTPVIPVGESATYKEIARRIGALSAVYSVCSVLGE